MPIKGPVMKKLGSRRMSVPVTSVVAVAAAVAVGLTPTVSSAPVLTAATVDYLRGTNIGWTPTDQQYRDFISRVLDGTNTPAATPTSAGNIAYNAGFWPVSNNYIFDKTWNQSVAQGVKNVEARDPQGDVIFGLSQGAVVLSRYKAAHPEGTGNTFVLVENPSRPNGGILERFAGLYIPVLDISVSGATPDNGDTTVDVARQYDGWADFPTYPLNLLATVNAIMGMIYVHGQTQTELTAADIEAAKAGGSAYYQQHGDTTYYLIRTPLVPLLMPLKGIVPDPILGAIDPVLRK
ncbi:MAG: PE-PPE domain-containing protein, partial [Mycolicibacterium aromaticivorans]|nr:PE-PPE domain-containing protein [Mycolicibacterium aromaticivorans]